MNDFLVGVPAEPVEQGFPPMSAFVASRVKINAELPFTLAPGCVIRRADERQISLIKKYLGGSVAPSMLDSIISRYECDQSIEQSTQGGTLTKLTPLPASDFRYYMVDTPDLGQTSLLLHHSADICDISLDLISLNFHGPYAEGGFGFRPAALNNYAFYDAAETKELDASSLQEIGEVFQLLLAAKAETGVGEKYPKAMKAVRMLDEVRLLPQYSNFRVLGLFSILELLISHNPTLADKGDSITHQMKTKMPLIMRRFDRRIDFKPFFGDCAADKIWGQMYGYRSAIAHGGNPDFSNNQKQGHLKDSRNANSFLEAVTIAAIRNYLREPDLYNDLSGV